MNKKQLRVAWVMGVLICLFIFSSPYNKLCFGRLPIYKERTELEKVEYLDTHSELKQRNGGIDFTDLLIPPKVVGHKWGFEKTQRSLRRIPFYLFRTILPTLIIGGLLIYTLRNKKK